MARSGADPGGHSSLARRHRRLDSEVRIAEEIRCWAEDSHSTWTGAYLVENPNLNTFFGVCFLIFWIQKYSDRNIMLLLKPMFWVIIVAKLIQNKTCQIYNFLFIYIKVTF